MEGIKCDKAKASATYFWGHLSGPSGWTCERSRGRSLMRGYCESNSGRRYFDWRPV